jgi:hypothetical protein
MCQVLQIRNKCMNTALLRSVSRQIGTFFIFCVFVYFGTVLSAEAATPDGSYGWYGIVTETAVDDFSCGPGEIRLVVDLKERDTNAPVAVDSALVMVTELSDGTVSEYVEEVGPQISSLCYNPETQGVAIDIDGGANFYNFRVEHEWANPTDVPRGKRYTATVWLTPTSYPSPEYEQVNPVGGVVNTLPPFEFDMNYIPSVLGATDVSAATLLVTTYDPADPDSIAIISENKFSLSGGVGRQSVPAPTLVDGMYRWAVQLNLNGSVDATPTFSVAELPESGSMNFGTPFVFDTTAPTTTTSHFPLSPTQLQTVTMRVDMTDTLAGVTAAQIVFNGAKERTCIFAAKNSATCVVTVGPFSSGTTHEYYMIARDAAGNEVTTATTSFSISPASLVFSPSCAVPFETTVDTAQADGGAAGFGALNAVVQVGNLIYTGGSGDANGMFIYDISDMSNIVQRSYFSTDNPLIVRNNFFGNDVTDVAVDGSYAYLTTLYGGLVIVDITNPDLPTFVGKRALHNLNPPTTRETWNVKIVGNFAYVAGGTGMFVIDITDKTSPVVVANLDLGAERSTDIVVNGTYAYVALGSQGFAIVDIATSTSPVEVLRLDDVFSPLILAYSLALHEEHLYVSAHFSNKVRVYNVTNPESPVYLTSVDADAPVGGAPRYLAVAEGLLYAAAGTGGVYVYDVSDPSIPTLFYRIDPSGLATNANVWGAVPLEDGEFTKLAIVSRTTSPTLYTVDVRCAPVADLKADTPTVSVTEAMPGETITFTTGNVLNRGNALAPAHDIAGFSIDANNDDIEDFSAPLPRQTVEINAEEQYSLSVDWVVPALAVPGLSYRVRYLLDPNYEVETLGETLLRGNNESPWSSMFTISPYTPPVPTGSITATDCSIPAGASSCDVSVAWNAVDFIATTSVQQGGVVFSSSTTASGVLRAAHPDNRTFSLYDTGSSFSDTVQAVVYCDPVSGAVWNGSTCALPPPTCPDGSFYHTASGICEINPGIAISSPAVLDLSKIWVRQGKITTLEYSVAADYEVSCTIYDGQIPAFSFVHDGTVTPIYTGTYTTRPTLSAQIVRVSCTAAGMSTPIETEFRVNVVPRVQES